MTNQTIKTTVTTPSSLDTGDLLFVSSSGLLDYSDTVVGAAVASAAAANQTRVIVNGSINAMGMTNQMVGIALGSDTGTAGGSGNNQVILGQYGSVTADGKGIWLTGIGNSVTSAGMITATRTAIQVDGDGGTIANTGSIIGKTGVYMTGSNGSIDNSGRITATDNGFSVTGDNNYLSNTGYIGGSVGMRLTGGSNTVMSGGTIQTTRGTGISNEGDAFSLVQTGTINSLSHGIISFGQGTSIIVAASAQVTSSFNSAIRVEGDFLRLTNSGGLSGLGGGIAVSGSAPLIINAGQITTDAASGIDVYGINAKLANSGDIHAALTGMLYNATVISGATVSIRNTGFIEAARGIGTVWAGDTADIAAASAYAHINNAGTIAATDVGVDGGDIITTLRNSGTITSDEGPTILNSGLNAMRVINTGTISSLGDTGDGPGVAILFGNGVTDIAANVLRNSGIVVGSVNMGNGDSVVRNEGRIDGAIYLENGNDRFDGRGGTMTEFVNAGAGNDTVIGSAADDTIYGDKGIDYLTGGLGDDQFYGGTGADILVGGAGNDTFIFFAAAEVSSGTARDHITDFKSGSDVIGLGFMGATGHYIGAAGFSKAVGEVRYVAATGLLQGDMNGDGKADFALVIDNHSAITASDLIL